MPITLTQFDKIEIEWIDAQLQYAGEFAASDAGGLCTMTRTGYFVRRARDAATGMRYLVVASERIGGDVVREPMSIPEGWVLKIRKLADGKFYGRRGPMAKKKKRKKEGY